MVAVGIHADRAAAGVFCHFVHVGDARRVGKSVGELLLRDNACAVLADNADGCEAFALCRFDRVFNLV